MAGVWLWRQCSLVGINVNQLIGKVPKNYKWLSLIGIVSARFAFSVGLFRVFYYLISFLAYSWVENKLKFNLSNSSLLRDLSKTFSSPLYLLVYFIFTLIVLAYFIFLGFGIALHRWFIKWGTKRTILYLCIFWSVVSILAGNYLLTPVIYIIVDILIYLQTRTLTLIGIAYVIDLGMSLFWSYSGINRYDLSINLVEQLRDRVWLGVIFLAVLTLFLMRFIYKNWHRVNEPLPYFTNASQ